MLKKYIPFWGLQILANGLWAFWVLPSLGESGSLKETLIWISAQVLIPTFLSLLILRGRKSAYWLTVVYGIMTAFYAMGMLGWSLSGEATPLSVYVVCLLLFIVAFGVVFGALKDLNIGQKARRYDEIKDE